MTETADTLLENFLDATWAERGLSENTLIVYTSDQGFYLGEHGWFDKRFMYEESLRMPFVIRYPQEIAPGTANQDIVCNVDFAPLFLEVAGVEVPDSMQGQSFRPMFAGDTPDDWREALYYRYWMHKAHHNVYAHYGLRTHRYKLIYYYNDALGQAGAIAAPGDGPAESLEDRRDLVKGRARRIVSQ